MAGSRDERVAARPDQADRGGVCSANSQRQEVAHLLLAGGEGDLVRVDGDVPQ